MRPYESIYKYMPNEMCIEKSVHSTGFARHDEDDDNVRPRIQQSFFETLTLDILSKIDGFFASPSLRQTRNKTRNNFNWKKLNWNAIFFLFIFSSSSHSSY